MGEQLELRPGAYSERNPLIGNPLGAIGAEVPVIIGLTNGGTKTVNDEALTKGAQGSQEPVSVAAVDSLLRVSLVSGGLGDYTQGVDFELDNNNEVKWLGTKLTAPAGLGAVGADTGGTLAAGDYNYVITATRTTNLTGPVTGETTISAAANVTTTGSTSKVTLTWTAVPLAEGYKIYRKLATDADYADKLIQTIEGGANTSFVDTGLAAGTGTPPVSNTAFKEPATGSTYYVSYTWTEYLYQQFKRYYSVVDVQNDHGVTSDVSRAAMLAMGAVGFGNGCAQIAVVGVQNNADSDFINALTLLEDYGEGEEFCIVPLRSSSTLFSAVISHVETMSNVTNRKERVAILGQKKGDILGDVSTPGSLIYTSRGINDRRVSLVDQPYVLANMLQIDGSFADVELNGYFLAAAVAGREAALPDPAESLTNKDIQGIKSLGVTYSEAEKKTAVLNGLLVVELNGVSYTVRRGIMTSQATVEDQQRSIVLADDDVARTWRQSMSRFIGMKIVPGLLDAARATTISVLNGKVKATIIAGFNIDAVTATQGTGSQRTWVIVTGSYRPIYPAEVFKFNYSFDLS